MSILEAERASEAANLYRSVGFVEWGSNRRLARVGGVVVAESHLVLAFESGSA
jgi:hypothetical protein